MEVSPLRTGPEGTQRSGSCWLGLLDMVLRVMWPCCWPLCPARMLPTSQKGTKRFFLAQPTKSQWPNTPDKIKAKIKDRHLNKPRNERQWKNTLAVIKINFWFWFLEFAFWISFGARCVWHPWLASWQGSLQVCFLCFKKKTFWVFFFHLKPKSLTLKKRNKTWNQKMLLELEIEIVLTVSAACANPPGVGWVRQQLQLEKNHSFFLF